MSAMDQLAKVFEVIAKLVKDYVYAIEDGCVENHLFEKHRRGTNWIATVTPNRAAPGGLDRVFWRKGSGAWYSAPSLAQGDVIEFAGDYSSARGNKTRDRSYVLVLRVESDHFVGVVIASTAPSARAVKLARAEHGLVAA